MNIDIDTKLIDLATGIYPMYLSQILSQRADLVFEEPPTDEIIRQYGFAVVHPVDRPGGDVVNEETPTLVDDQYYQTWSAREFTQDEIADQLDKRKQELAAALLAIREADLAGGFLHVVDENTIFGVQLRPEDRVNLIGLRMEAMYLVDKNIDMMNSFRSTENISYTLTPQQLLDLCNKALVAGKQIYANSWVIKDQIEQATTLAQLPVLPNTLVP